MAAEITKVRSESIGFVAEERLWLTSDGKTIVRDGDWRSSQLLVAKGGIVPDKVAKRLGFHKGQINIEPLQKSPPKTVAPEEIEQRTDRSEKPSEKR